MAEGQADIAGACPGGGGGVDRISGLPDHLLHSILLLIPGGTAADAARTSVLSRRWRHVWAHLPELALRYREASYARAHRHVDAALAAYAAPTVRRLEITVPYGSPHLTAGRLSSWLRFAALRLAGGGALRLSAPHDVPDGDTEELLLPVWETVTSISLDFLFSSRTLRFRLLPGGAAAFTALAFLKIRNARVGGRELEHVLSSRCPGLTELVLERVSLREGDDDVVLSIRSASLQRLQMDSGDFAGLLRVATPELQVLTLHCIHGDAYIAAPKLSELYWGEPFYDPSRHRFAETTARHLRRMMVATGSPTMALMERFDIVGELDMTLYVRQGVHRYEKLLEETSRLARCEVLVLKFAVVKHDFKPIMVHLLQQCAGIRKLVVEFTFKMGDRPCKLWGCPCGRIENRKTNRVVLRSLERVEVKGGGEAEHEAELVRMLCKCHATFKKKVSISVRTTYTLRQISRIVPPNDKYEVTSCE